MSASKPSAQKPNVIFHRTFEQGEVWWDRRGRPHLLVEMDLAYLRNVIRFLERRAGEFCLVELVLRLCEEAGGLYMTTVPHPRYFDGPLAWLRATPLLHGLYGEVDRRLGRAGEATEDRRG